MLAVHYPGLQNERFVDINQVHHRFPEELKDIGFATTLLHNHPHVPSGYFLVYKNDFTTAEYLPLTKITNNYFPCSWYLDAQEIMAY
jgi:hypothetical protein